MGVCNSSNGDKRKSNPNRKNGNTNHRDKTKSRGLVKADLDDDSHQISENNMDQRDRILKRGQRKELQNMIDNYDEEIDDYAFGQNKTLLLQACMICPNPDVVDMIMAKGADVDKEEYQTGNTALFLSAVDLKVDFVRKLLNYNPNLQHRNHAGQNIFDFLNFQLFEQRQKIGREMTDEERDKYQEIENMLNDYVGKE